MGQICPDHTCEVENQKSSRRAWQLVSPIVVGSCGCRPCNAEPQLPSLLPPAKKCTHQVFCSATRNLVAIPKSHLYEWKLYMFAETIAQSLIAIAVLQAKSSKIWAQKKQNDGSPQQDLGIQKSYTVCGATRATVINRFPKLATTKSSKAT